MVRITYAESDKDWIAIFKGKVLAKIPIKSGEIKPPRWFKELATEYAKNKLRRLI